MLARYSRVTILRMNLILDRIVLGRKTECIPSHRIQVHCIPAFCAFLLRYPEPYMVGDVLHEVPVLMDKGTLPVHNTLALCNHLSVLKAFSSSQTFCHFFSTTLWLYSSDIFSSPHLSLTLEITKKLRLPTSAVRDEVTLLRGTTLLRTALCAGTHLSFLTRITRSALHTAGAATGFRR